MTKRARRKKGDSANEDLTTKRTAEDNADEDQAASTRANAGRRVLDPRYKTLIDRWVAISNAEYELSADGNPIFRFEQRSSKQPDLEYRLYFEVLPQLKDHSENLFLDLGVESAFNEWRPLRDFVGIWSTKGEIEYLVLPSQRKEGRIARDGFPTISIQEPSDELIFWCILQIGRFLDKKLSRTVKVCKLPISDLASAENSARSYSSSLMLQSHDLLPLPRVLRFPLRLSPTKTEHLAYPLTSYEHSPSRCVASADACLSSGDAVGAFILYYQSIEHYMHRLWRQDAIFEVRRRLANPRFRLNNDEHIADFLAATSAKYGKLDELKMLKEMFDRYADKEHLAKIFDDQKDVREYFSGTKRSVFTDMRRRVYNGDGECVSLKGDNLYKDLAVRMYGIRNSLVHSKDKGGDVSFLHPWSLNTEGLFIDNIVMRSIARSIVTSHTKDLVQ